MKIINPYRGAALPSPNTFIGGVGATSVTSIADFIALTSGITAANIFNFQIDSNNNVSFFCDSSYSLDSNAFINDLNITYYIDEKCTFLNTASLKFTTPASYFYFPNVTGTGSAVWNAPGTPQDNIKVISIPLCTPIGGSVGDDSCFRDAADLDYVITHLDNQTNNSSNPDGDLTGAGVTISNIRYVTNTTPPANISDLTVDTVFGSLLEISWSAPSTTNAIIYYEVWVNDAFIDLTTSINFLLTGLSLNTSYKIQIKTLDEFGNRSGFSNTVNQTTSATYVIPTGNIVSYWNLNSNSDDSVGSNDGSDTSISYVSGKISNAASFNGSSSFIEVADSADLTFTDGDDIPFSISMNIRFASTSGTILFFNKISSSNREYEIRYASGKLLFYLYDTTSAKWINVSKTITFTLNTWYHIVATYDGSNANTGMNLYRDGDLIDGVSRSSAGTYVKMANTTATLKIGKYFGGLYFNGIIDELAIFDTELTAIQIIEIVAKNEDDLGLTD